MNQRYASLVGPLLGLYYPLPNFIENAQLNDIAQRTALYTSKLARLWCAIYDEGDVDVQIAEHGGYRLPSNCASQLDYDAYAVANAIAKYASRVNVSDNTCGQE